jgi:asparagine synthase (glutamine-hydrolysing)
MCGIGGILEASNVDVQVAGLRRMGQVMAARGPDHEGLFVAPGIGLVHRRLSILDLSEQGNCPMPNEDGSIHALLNGEIYNWRELRAELVARGHRFRSMSDSEVLCHAYEAWGESMFERLRGMFAVAIWDVRCSRLVLARDRVGEKPLFVMQDAGRTLFASSVNALRAYDQCALAIDPDAIVCYLAHSFIPATHTAWHGIRVVPPAHVVTIDDSHELASRRYWRFPTRANRSVSVAVAEHQIERVLDDSVGRCLDADVPVGVFLSGGVDSSVVAALAARRCPGLHSFSVGFEEAAWSELPFARAVAERLGLQHHEVIVHPEDVLRVLPRLVWHYGQPFGDASAVPTFVVSKLAREQVKVCLSGDGGDESFAGYWRIQSGAYAARYGALVPERVRTHVVPAVAQLLGSLGRRVSAMNTLSLAAPGSGYTNSQSWHDALDEVAGPLLRAALGHDRVGCRVGGRHVRDLTAVQCLLLDDFQVQLPDAYLAKVDVASMAASLEVRAPLLDVALLEAAWLLPDRMKLRWGCRKWLLKRIASRLVFPDVSRRPKMGFAMPLARWFAGKLGVALERLLDHSIAAREGWIEPAHVLRELAMHRAGKHDVHTRLWLILWLELWFRVVITGQLDRGADLTETLGLCAS